MGNVDVRRQIEGVTSAAYVTEILSFASTNASETVVIDNTEHTDRLLVTRHFPLFGIGWMHSPKSQHIRAMRILRTLPADRVLQRQMTTNPPGELYSIALKRG